MQSPTSVDYLKQILLSTILKTCQSILGENKLIPQGEFHGRVELALDYFPFVATKVLVGKNFLIVKKLFMNDCRIVK